MGNLKRFKEAQSRDYDTALAEIGNGKKRSHWIWYIFPQIQGSGITDISHHYAIADIAEATDYLMDQDLGIRLIIFAKPCYNVKPMTPAKSSVARMIRSLNHR